MTNGVEVGQVKVGVTALAKGFDKTKEEIKALQKEIEETADSSKEASKDLKGTSKEIDKAGKAAEKAENRVKKLRKRLSGLSKSFIAAGVAYLSIRSVKRIVAIADEFSILEQRVKTATRATGDFESSFLQLNRIAADTGASTSSVVSLFQNISRVKVDLNATNQEALDFADTLSKLSVIGGASASGIRAGILQLSQGLGEGILRAQEYNSIMENLPEVASRLARGMKNVDGTVGVTQGKLREMVRDGKVLSTDVFQALLSQSEDIAFQFETIDLSVSRASEAFKSSFGTWLGQILGIRKAIAQIIQDWGDFFKDLNELNQAEELGIDEFPALKAQERKIRNEKQYLRQLYLGNELLTERKQLIGQSSASIELGTAATSYVQREDNFLKKDTSLKEALQGTIELSEGLTKEVDELFGTASDRAETFLLDTNEKVKLALKITAKIHSDVLAEGANLFKEAEGSLDFVQEERLNLIEEQRKERLLQLSRDVADLEKEYQNQISSLGVGDPTTLEELTNKKITSLLELEETLQKNIVEVREKNKGDVEKTAEAELKVYENHYKSRISLESNYYKESERLQKELDKKSEKELEAFTNLFEGKLQAEKEYNDKLKEFEEEAPETAIEAIAEHLSEIRDLEEDHQEKLQEIKEDNFSSLTEKLETELELYETYYDEKFDLAREHENNLKRIEQSEIKNQKKKDDTLREIREKAIDDASESLAEGFKKLKLSALAEGALDLARVSLAAFSKGIINSTSPTPVTDGLTALGTAVAVGAPLLAAIALTPPPRQAGGRVDPYSMYRVGEAGAEILDFGSKKYLITGERSGNVTPNNQIGGNTTVNVINNNNSDVSVQQQQSNDGETIQVLIESIKGDIVQDLYKGGNDLTDAVSFTAKNR